MTCKAAHEEVQRALKDAPFQYGPYGEALSIMHFLFLTSTADLPGVPDSPMAPVSGEASISLDWQLPMPEEAQGMLFRRIRLAFEKSTAIVQNAVDRKKYRMSEEDLLALRNVLCLWCQVFDMRLNNKELKGGFETKNLHYLSVWWLNNQSFGAARLMREITDAWIAQKWEIGGIRFSNDPPELSQIELDAIPGAKGALGSLDGVAWEVLERNGDQMVIRKDEDRYWSMQDGSIGDTFKGLKEKHNELIGRTNVTATSSAGAAPASATASTEAEGSGDGGQPTPASAVMVESIAKLEEMHGIETRSASEVANTELLMCKDGSLWLVATQGDKLVAKHTVLGGFGTGQWVPEADAPDTSVSFAMPFAYRNKMEIALGSAVGSAVQISVFVIPLCVVIGWMMDKPTLGALVPMDPVWTTRRTAERAIRWMTMNFHIFETSTMLLTSVSIAIILMDGKANWLKGTMLILGYCIIGAGFWAHADPDQILNTLFAWPHQDLAVSVRPKNLSGSVANVFRHLCMAVPGRAAATAAAYGALWGSLTSFGAMFEGGDWMVGLGRAARRSPDQS
eukprot:g5327.t1